MLPSALCGFIIYTIIAGNSDIVTAGSKKIMEPCPLPSGMLQSCSRSPSTVLRTAGWFFAHHYGTVPTSLRDAFPVPWIFPRPKQVSPGHLLTLAALGPAFQIRLHQQKINPIRMDGVYFLAEKEGFEPSKPFWGLHDFQSCALGQLRDFSIPFLSSSVATDWLIIQHTSPFVNTFFEKFQNYFSGTNW